MKSGGCGQVFLHHGTSFMVQTASASNRNIRGNPPVLFCSSALTASLTSSSWFPFSTPSRWKPLAPFIGIDRSLLGKSLGCSSRFFSRENYLQSINVNKDKTNIFLRLSFTVSNGLTLMCYYAKKNLLSIGEDRKE